MFGRVTGKQAPSHHTETRFLEKDLSSDWVETAQLLLFYKSEAKQGVSRLNVKLLVTLGSFHQTQLHLKHCTNSSF